MDSKIRKLIERHWCDDVPRGQCPCGCCLMADTMEKMWVVVEAARKWRENQHDRSYGELDAAFEKLDKDDG